MPIRPDIFFSSGRDTRQADAGDEICTPGRKVTHLRSIVLKTRTSGLSWSNSRRLSQYDGPMSCRKVLLMTVTAIP